MRLLRRLKPQLQFLYRALGAFTTVVNIIAVLAVIAALVAPESWWGRAVVAVAALVATARVLYLVREDAAAAERRTLVGNSVIGRLAVTVASAVLALTNVEHVGWAQSSAALLLLLLIGEQTLQRPLKSVIPFAAHLPDAEIDLPSTTLDRTLFLVVTGGVLLLTATGVFGITAVPAFIVAVIALGLTITIGLQAARYLVQRRRLERQLPAILAKLSPAFCFHWQAPAGTAYQAAMWLPYLERVGPPYFVLVRTIANFHEVSKMTKAPVILRVGLEDLDPIVTPSLKVVFYANTAVRNSHMIRFPALTHIQLNHGDSDKIASVSPTFRQYDRNFVAGQAAIDRFATHGVSTLPDQFEIVGRPQLENVQSAVTATSDVPQPTVLYCPTWSGFYEDSDYSSLAAGPAIVQALLDRGCRVIFRPHPYARRHRGNARSCDEIFALLEADTRAAGVQHVFGPTAETTMNVVDCFNASDAMVSDVSSVTSDYLISGKPFAMAAVSAHAEEFLAEFPLGRAAYVFDVHKGSANGFDAVLDAMLGDDPMAETRRSLRTYYLSDTPSEQIAERFLETARRYLA